MPLRITEFLTSNLRSPAVTVPFPAVCIGGIDADRLPALIRGGARSWAVVRAVCAADDPYAAILRLQSVAREAAL